METWVSIPVFLLERELMLATMLHGKDLSSLGTDRKLSL